MKEPSIFTQIINGDIPCHRVYEDGYTLAFLDIYAVVPGHTLVIPKKQVEFVWDLDTSDYQHLMASVQKVALRLRNVMGTSYVGEKIVGVDVPHAHVHVIPFNNSDEMAQANQATNKPNHEALAALAAKLHFE